MALFAAFKELARCEFQDINWTIVYDYLNEHKDKYRFNSILNGIIEANNKELDGVDYYEEIFARGKYDYLFYENEDSSRDNDFISFIQDIARTEDKHKFDDDHKTKDKSFLLGWLFVCPDGTCGEDEGYTGKFKDICMSCDCHKYCEECNCGNAYCYHVEDLALMLKTILPGIEFN